VSWITDNLSAEALGAGMWEPGSMVAIGDFLPGGRARPPVEPVCTSPAELHTAGA
jgi:hypothetical protein